MNHFFYEQRAKENIKNLQAEGLRSQGFYRSGAPKLGLLPGLSKLTLSLLGILGLLALLVR
jgi:hypothetical protein